MAVGIGGSNTLTITPGSSATGITVATGSGNHTISSKVALGAAQTWTVTDAGQTLSASNEISGGFALTKAGAGTLTLSGANTYTGPTTVSAGMLLLDKQVSLYNGNTADWTAANLSVASGATLAFKVGGPGEFTAGNVTTLLGNLTTGINNNGLQAGANIGFDTTNAAGGTFTIADIISNSVGTGSGSLGVAKLGANTLVLSGVNSYTGQTTINGGTLDVTGSLDATALSVNGGATLSGTGTIGTSGGGSVTLVGSATPASRGTISLVNGSTGTLTTQSTASADALLLGSGSQKGILNFEIAAPGSSDKIAIGNGANVNATGGGAVVNITGLSGFNIGNYDLITFAGAGNQSGFDNLSLGTTPGFGGGGLSYALANTNTAWQLAVTQAAAGTAAYWGGTQSATWNTITGGFTNWSSDVAGTTNAALPGAITDVYFTTTSASNTGTTLGAPFAINSLTFRGAGTASSTSTSITGSTLTLNAGAGAYAAGTGIVVESGSAATGHTISSDIILGANQSWTNSSSGLLTISGSTITGSGINLTVAGTGNTLISAAIQTTTGTLTKTGSGTQTLTGANTYTGGTTVQDGALIFVNNHSGSSNFSTLSPGTLEFNVTSGQQQLSGGALTGNGTVVKSGAGDCGWAQMG